MRFKIIILLLTLSSLSFGQDSLQTDTTTKQSKPIVTNAKKNRKKNKQVKKNTSKYNNKERITYAGNTEENDDSNKTAPAILIFLIFVLLAILVFKYSGFKVNRRHIPDPLKDENPLSDELMRTFLSRQDYYRNVYLKSNAWKRKRYVVLRRDSWRCVYCGGRATQVHHKKYAPVNIGKEPIEWLVSVCKLCHDSKHN